MESEAEQDELDYIGFVRLVNNDRDIRVYFTESDETDIIKAGFVVFDKIDEKTGKKKFILINQNYIRYIEYEEEK